MVGIGRARLWRAVFGVAPNTFVSPLFFRIRFFEKSEWKSRCRDGNNSTRDACAPISTAWFRLKTNWLVAFLILLSTFFSGAHTLPISDLMLVADEDYLHLELLLNPSELNFPAAADALEKGEKIITQKILDHLSVTIGAKGLTAETAGVGRSGESHHLALRAHYPLAGTTGRLRIESRLGDLTSASHFTQVTFRQGDLMQLAQLDQQTPSADFKLVRAAPSAAGENSRASAENQAFSTGTDAPSSFARRKWLALVLLLTLPAALVLFSTLANSAHSAKYEVLHAHAADGDDDRHACFRR